MHYDCAIFALQFSSNNFNSDLVPEPLGERFIRKLGQTLNLKPINTMDDLARKMMIVKIIERAEAFVKLIVLLSS